MAVNPTLDAPAPQTAVHRRFEVTAALGGFVANNWKVVLYVVLIIMCVLFAPEEPLKFIYTEF